MEEGVKVEGAEPLPPWRNRLARSAVNRKVGGSSPPGGGGIPFGHQHTSKQERCFGTLCWRLEGGFESECARGVDEVVGGLRRMRMM